MRYLSVCRAPLPSVLWVLAAMTACGPVLSPLPTLAAAVDQRDVRVPMRDGKFLAADVLLPAAEGQFPTIFIHTPYKRESAAAPLPDSPFLKELLAREHYAYVMTDWRGFFGSKDAALGLNPTPLHGRDGYDAIEWIARQPWSNGKVGMWGHSAVGSVQFKVALEKPPHLVCAVPASGTIGAPYEQYYHGGVLKKNYLDVLLGVGHEKYANKDLLLAHPAKDVFWTLADLSFDRSRVDLPMLFITGWFDNNHDCKVAAFKELRTERKRHFGDMKLIIGPWHHAAFGKKRQGALEFAEAEEYTSQETLRFFDYYLRDRKDNGWGNEPPVRYLQMGANTWRHAPDWPPTYAEQVYYLRAGGQLALDKPGQEEPDTFVYDPHDPVPTVGGSNVELKAIVKQKRLQDMSLDAGPQDLRERVESRKDVLAYTTAALVQDLDVAGVVKVRLQVSSDREDTDFAVWLTDVYPDGRSMLVTDGIWRMRYRDSLVKSEAMVPDRIYEVTVPLEATAQSFLKGHRLRILVSSSNYPRF
ncbi:MAG: CocE/NonD family hydrolase, partial [Planctomycetes bacterium]|nr:CocE/NonD family hydrolase [Planctomycetota bacterium]